MAADTKKLSRREHSHLVQRALCLLITATCFALISHTIRSEQERQAVAAERQNVQMERAEKKRIAARYKEIEERPTEEYFVYTAIDSVNDPSWLGEDLLIQSTAAVHQAGNLDHDDVMECWSVNEKGERYGKSTMYRRVRDTVPLGSPRYYGAVKLQKLPYGYEWKDGVWVFPDVKGSLPKSESDCKMTAHPCMLEPEFGIQKCLKKESSWIRLREKNSA